MADSTETNQIREASIGEIAEQLRDRHGCPIKTCLLIGAGVSVTAGIGLASDFVKLIERDYAYSYKRAQSNCSGRTPGYADCMSALPPAKQVELVRTDIDTAQINWAHIGIARLESIGLFDKILTPNFDPLVSRACALFNNFPAIYDLAGLRTNDFDASFIKGSAVFHLHGQHTGFLLLNTEKKLRDQATKIRPVLNAVVKGHPLIIAGYSGENDPLVDEIASLAPFNHGLFWVCHDDRQPAANVCEKLLSRDDCAIVRNMPADKFFTELANAMGATAPAILVNPFRHMLSIYDTIKPYKDVGAEPGLDLLASARSRIERCLSQDDIGHDSGDQIRKLMALDEYHNVWDQFAVDAEKYDDSVKDQIAWAAIMIANGLNDQALVAPAGEADALFSAAAEKYAAALVIRPNRHEALNNWGNVLSNQARRKQPGPEADILFEDANQKYAAAIAIKSDKHETFNNWGSSLGSQAQGKGPADADRLYLLAGEKFAAALAIEPKKHSALTNWGNALYEQAITKSRPESDQLYERAIEKYSAALELKPDKHEALNSLGLALSSRAQHCAAEDADRLFALAAEKYAAALAIKPDKIEALYNWGAALGAQANKAPLPRANPLYDLAYEKFSAAFAIDPRSVGALNNWANILGDQARRKSSRDADRLFKEAGKKYAAALAIEPTKYESLCNWAATLGDQARIKSAVKAQQLLAEAEEKCRMANTIRPGAANYNLACLAALRGDAGEAGRMLLASYSGPDFAGCDQIENDEDFDGIRSDVAFNDALKAMGCII